MGLLMLDESATVAAVTWADPGTGEIEKGPSKSTRTVPMRIQPISGRYREHLAGKRTEATHKAFADSDAALVEGEMVGVAAGVYAGYRWEIVFVDPVHGDHYEVEMQRIPSGELESGADPLG